MTIIQKYQLAVYILVAVINVLLVVNGILVRKLHGKDLDRKIDRGRKVQKRMEEHPKRTGDSVFSEIGKTGVSLDQLASAMQTFSENAGVSWNGGPE